MDSSNLSVANSQQMLTGGGNPGGNNDGTSHVHTGDSGDRNSIEADMSGDNGSNLSSTTATTNASPKHLQLILDLANANLKAKGKAEMTMWS